MSNLAGLLPQGFHHLNDASIALHKALVEAGLKGGIFGGTSVHFLGGDKGRDVDALVEATNTEIIEKLGSKPGFKSIGRGNQANLASFQWSHHMWEHGASIEIFCCDKGAIRKPMKEVTVKGERVYGTEQVSILDYSYIFKSALFAAARQAKQSQKEDKYGRQLEFLADSLSNDLKMPPNQYSLTQVGLALTSYKNLENVFKTKLTIDVEKAKADKDKEDKYVKVGTENAIIRNMLGLD